LNRLDPEKLLICCVSQMSVQDLGTQSLVGVAAGLADRRRWRRFEMRLACRILSPEMRFEALIGITHDVGRSGALVMLRGQPASAGWMRVGDRARLMLELPRHTNFSPRCLECKAKVVRIDIAGEDRFSVGYKIQRMRVCSRDGHAWDVAQAFAAMTRPQYVN
jgi:hypothetical protein